MLIYNFVVILLLVGIILLFSMCKRILMKMVNYISVIMVVSLGLLYCWMLKRPSVLIRKWMGCSFKLVVILLKYHTNRKTFSILSQLIKKKLILITTNSKILLISQRNKLKLKEDHRLFTPKMRKGGNLRRKIITRRLVKLMMGIKRHKRYWLQQRNKIYRLKRIKHDKGAIHPLFKYWLKNTIKSIQQFFISFFTFYLLLFYA